MLVTRQQDHRDYAGRGHTQALVVDDLDDRSDAFLTQLRRRCRSKRAITEEQRPVFAFRELGGFADGKRTDSDGYGDGRGAIGGSGWHADGVAVAFAIDVECELGM